MAFSSKYGGKGQGRGCPSFRGCHNKARFLTLLILANVHLRYKQYYPWGIPVSELSRLSGVKATTLFRNLPRWHRWRFVKRIRRPQGFHTAQCYRIGFGSAQCFYYEIAERGIRWLREYSGLVPKGWYQHLVKRG